MLWQEANPDIPVFEGHDGFLADRMARIDDNFRLFLQRGVKHEIRLEEITKGGVVKDGIPALTNPDLVSPDDELAAYLKPDELVFSVSINGDTRAYPLRFLDWHEMFNDVIGGKPASRVCRQRLCDGLKGFHKGGFLAHRSDRRERR